MNDVSVAERYSIEDLKRSKTTDDHEAGLWKDATFCPMKSKNMQSMPDTMKVLFFSLSIVPTVCGRCLRNEGGVGREGEPVLCCHNGAS